MKRLLLLLILSPIILLAQQRAQDAIDSNQDIAINLRSMASSMSNDRCTKVADIHITDNGENAAIIVFLHVITASDSVIDGNIPTDTVIKVTRQEPRVIKEITPVDIVVIKVNTEEPPVIKEITRIDIVVIKANTEEPLVIKEITPLDIVVIKANTEEPPIIKEITPIDIVVIKANIEEPLVIKEITPVDIVVINANAEEPLVIKEITPVDIVVINASTEEPPVSKEITPTETVTPVNKENTITGPPKPDETRTPVEDMHLSPDGYSLLEKLEGYSPGLYTLGDGGYTIGFGLFVPFNEGYKWSKGITWEGAEHMIQQKVPAYEAQVKEYINVPLTQNEFDALTMLAYNLGGFSKATSIINDVNEQVDLDKLQRDWKKFVHSKAQNVSKGLMKRRKDEIEVRKLSNYQPERKIQIFKSGK